MSQNNDQWALVVTLEKNKHGEEVEIETVVPYHWITEDGKWLWWPPTRQEEKKSKEGPNKKTWAKCRIVKVKLRGSKDYCNKAQITTSASENEASQNQNKEKTDFSIKIPSKPQKNILESRSSSSTPSDKPSHSKHHSPPKSPVSKSRPPSKIRSRSHSSQRHSSPNSQEKKSRSRSRSRSDSHSYRSHSKSLSPVHHKSFSPSHYNSFSRSPPNKSFPITSSKSRHHSYSTQRRRSRSPINHKSRSSHSYSPSSHSQTLNKQHSSSSAGNAHPSASKNPSSHTRSRSVSPIQNKKQPKMNNKAQFPMEESRFQKKVITLLLKLIDQQECRAKPTAVTNTEVIRMVENIEEFKELEESLSNKDIFSSFVDQLKLVGGKLVRENVRNVMKRLMSYVVMADFNMYGKKRKDGQQKIAFKGTKVCDVVIASVLPNHKTTEADVLDDIMTVLKYAPDQANRMKKD